MTQSKIVECAYFCDGQLYEYNVYQCIYHVQYFCTEFSKYYTHSWMYYGLSACFFNLHVTKVSVSIKTRFYTYSNLTLVYVYHGTSRKYTHYARHHVQHGNAKYRGAHDAHHHTNVVKGLRHGQKPSTDSSLYHMHQCFVVPV